MMTDNDNTPLPLPLENLHPGERAYRKRLARQSGVPISGAQDGRPALLDLSQQDRALRDLMPIVEWLTAADTALIEGAPILADGNLHAALAALRSIGPDSPAVKAYLRWLEQNTHLGLEPGVSLGPT